MIHGNRGLVRPPFPARGEVTGSTDETACRRPFRLGDERQAFGNGVRHRSDSNIGSHLPAAISKGDAKETFLNHMILKRGGNRENKKEQRTLEAPSKSHRQRNTRGRSHCDRTYFGSCPPFDRVESLRDSRMGETPA